MPLLRKLSVKPLPPPRKRPVRRAAPPPAVTHIDAFDSLDRASHRVAVKLFRRLSLERAWLLWLRESTRRHADAERGAVRLRAFAVPEPAADAAAASPAAAWPQPLAAFTTSVARPAREPRSKGFQSRVRTPLATSRYREGTPAPAPAPVPRGGGRGAAGRRGLGRPFRGRIGARRGSRTGGGARVAGGGSATRRGAGA